jgi:hypothetical protein
MEGGDSDVHRVRRQAARRHGSSLCLLDGEDGVRPGGALVVERGAEKGEVWG